MTVVLDSCVTVKWELTEIDSDKAVRLRDDARMGLREFIAPDVFLAEFAHAITRAERQGRITPAEGAIAVTSILVELPVFYPTAGLLPRGLRHLLDGQDRRLRLPVRRPGRAGGVRPRDGGRQVD